jgi:hypothetical protein
MDFDKIITGIRKALYGREVREYIASAIEWVKSAITDALEKMKELLKQAEAARDAAKASADKSAASATDSANSAMESKRSADASAKSATASANSANESAGYASDSANSANESAGYASDSAASAAASEASAKNSANAAMKALQEAADSGAFKGDKGDTGPQGPSGTTNASEINAGILGISYGGTGASTLDQACGNLLWRDTIPENCNWDTLATGIWCTIPERWGTNGPSGVYTYGIAMVWNYAGNVTQVYIAHSTGEMAFRQRWTDGNDFSGWARVTTGGTLSAYPVGAIYISTSSTSPASLFGGTWESIASERVLMGVSSSHGAGSTVSAGLPNITGVLKDLFVSDHFNQSTGVFKRSHCSTFSQQTDRSDWLGWAEAQFYASDSNSIYGNASTVQPAAYYVYMWRRTA